MRCLKWPAFRLNVGKAPTIVGASNYANRGLLTRAVRVASKHCTGRELLCPEVINLKLQKHIREPKMARFFNLSTLATAKTTAWRPVCTLPLTGHTALPDSGMSYRATALAMRGCLLLRRSQVRAPGDPSNLANDIFIGVARRRAIL